MNFKNWLENNQNDLIIPAGTKLYHGSIEPFKSDHLKPGGYDQILWTAENPWIAQTYIPTSGGSIYVSPNSLIRPSSNQTVTAIQKKLGIFYDLDSVEWQLNGKPNSWNLPKKLDGSYWQNLDGETIEKLLKNAGYTSKNGDGIFANYEINLNGNKIMPPNERQRGRLFIITVQKPLKIFDTQKESDLTDIEYHNHKLFRWAESNGYDGIKISDFAQHDREGNIGHQSIGIFQNSIKKLKWETIQARHPNYGKLKNQNTEEMLKFNSRQTQ